MRLDNSIGWSGPEGRLAIAGLTRQRLVHASVAVSVVRQRVLRRAAATSESDIPKT